MLFSIHVCVSVSSAGQSSQGRRSTGGTVSRLPVACPVSPVGSSSASALCTASLRRQCISRELWSKLEQQFVQVVYTPAGGAVSRRSASLFCSSRLGLCSRRVDVSTSSVQCRGVRVQQRVKSNGAVKSVLLFFP